MIIEIDQSEKIENTSKNTVVAFSNGESGSLFISSVDKRKIKEFFRQIGKTKIYVYKMFAILIFILIKEKISRIDRIITDSEYPGHDSLIKNILLEKIWAIEPEFEKERIIFDQIGKKSNAHLLAYGITIGRLEADRKINSKQFFKYL